MIAIEQLGDLVFLKFLSIAIQGICLLVQHRFDPVSECIDGNDDALEFKGVGLACLRESSLTEGIGLMDHRIKGRQNFTKRIVGEQPCNNGCD